MKMSASEIVKRSASQLLFKELKRIQWNATSKQIKGNKYAEKIVKKEEASAEKRGIINLGKHLLFFCIDMIKDNKCIEIKMVDDMDNYEDWYLYSSIMQATFYASLLQRVKTLDTPKFRKKQGFKQEIIVVPDNFEFELWFGKDKYRVFPNDKIYNHYLNKINIVVSSIKDADFDKCRKFDSKFKHKEFSIFKPKFKKINN